MRRLRTVARFGILPDLFVFRCPSCRSVQVVEPHGVARNALSQAADRRRPIRSN